MGQAMLEQSVGIGIAGGRLESPVESTVEERADFQEPGDGRQVSFVATAFFERSSFDDR